MGKWNVSKDDVARGQLVKPGWHEAEIVKFEEKLAKDQGSMNANLQFRVTSGDNAGAILFHTFNEKATGFMVPFIEALGGTKNPDGGYSVELSETVLKGKKLRVNVIRGEYNGKAQNNITEFAPV